MKCLLCIALLGTLAACNDAHTDNPAQISDTVTRSFSGQPVGDFFLKHGYNHAERDLPGGDHLYLWASAGGLDVATGYATTHYCELHIRTDPEDVIEDIHVAVDSMGKWSASRCAELLYSHV